MGKPSFPFHIATADGKKESACHRTSPLVKQIKYKRKKVGGNSGPEKCHDHYALDYLM